MVVDGYLEVLAEDDLTWPEAVATNSPGTVELVSGGPTIGESHPFGYCTSHL